MNAFIATNEMFLTVVNMCRIIRRNFGIFTYYFMAVKRLILCFEPNESKK